MIQMLALNSCWEFNFETPFLRFSIDRWCTDWKNYPDTKLLDYLRGKEQEKYEGVSYTDLRQNCHHQDFEPMVHIYSDKRRHPFFIYAFYYDVYAAGLTEFKWKLEHRSHGDGERCYHRIGVVTLFYLTWIAGPVYVASRFFNISMPLLVALYLYYKGNGMVLFVDVDMFQVTMWCIYCVLLVIWFCLAMMVMRDSYILWHILPSTGYLKGTRDQSVTDSVMKQIKSDYFGLVQYSVVRGIVEHTFGPDVAVIVLLYFNNIILDESGTPQSGI